MPQTRPQYKAAVNASIFTNLYKFIKGNTVRDKLNLLSDNVLFIIDDANVAGGYMAIDTNGLVDVSFIQAASPTGAFLRDDGTYAVPAGLPYDLEDTLTEGNKTGANNIIFDGGYGIDTNLNTETLNIGATNALVINYGNAGTTHNFLGTAIYELQVNSYVEDKLMTLNYGGAVSSAIGVGFEMEENGIITGYLKTNAARSGYSFKAPAIGFVADLSLASLSANRIFTLPDVAGTVALINGGQTFSSAVWNGTPIAGAYMVNAGVTGQVLTGFTSGAGAISAADTILGAIQKLDGNNQVQDEAFDLALQAAHLYFTNR
jgi:hypothetical protein